MTVMKWSGIAAGLAAAVLVVSWATYTTRRSAQSAIADTRRDVDREWTSQYQRFVNDLNRDEYAPEWKRGMLDAVNVGTDRLQAGDFKAAAAAFERAQSADPNNAYLLTLTGWALLQGGDASAAAKYFDTAVFAHPDYVWGYYQLAVAHCASGHVLAARDAALSALSASPSLDRIVTLDPTLAAKCPTVVKEMVAAREREQSW
jgi:tetratricopeptide (TPR) repeat protein